MIVSFIVFLSISFLIINQDTKLKNTYKNFFEEINILKIIKFYQDSPKLEEKAENSKPAEIQNFPDKSLGTYKWEGIILLDNSGYNRIYRTAITMWMEQPLFGFGLKSFRIKCWEILTKKSHLAPSSGIARFSCSNHPHNHYLELLSETGIIGLGLMIVFFLILIKISFFYLKKFNQNEKVDLEIFLLLPFIIVIFIEIWPIRSTGSFFTTWTSTFFWLSVSILLAAKKEN